MLSAKRVIGVRGNMTQKYTIIDGHAHTFSSEVSSKIIQSFNKIYNIDFINSGTGTVSDVLKVMNENNIAYTIMANFAPPKILHDNNLWTINMSKKHKSLIPLVSFHPDMEGDLCILLEYYIEHGARGIKIHPMAQGFEPGHTGLKRLYEYCNSIRFPIVFHCGRVSNARLNEYSDIDRIIPVIEKYCHIPFILTHMADGNIEYVVSLANKYENVFFDTSIVITGYPPILKVNQPSWREDSTVESVIKEIGAEKVLFGSDYPWGSAKHDIERFIKMDLSEEQKKLILGENSKKLFCIK